MAGVPPNPVTIEEGACVAFFAGAVFVFYVGNGDDGGGPCFTPLAPESNPTREIKKCGGPADPLTHPQNNAAGWEREIKPKAIEPLQRFLNEGMQDRKITDLFGPKQYVHIYTYVPSPSGFTIYVCPRVYVPIDYRCSPRHV